MDTIELKIRLLETIKQKQLALAKIKAQPHKDTHPKNIAFIEGAIAAYKQILDNLEDV